MPATPESVWEYLQEVGKKLEKVGYDYKGTMGVIQGNGQKNKRDERRNGKTLQKNSPRNKRPKKPLHYTVGKTSRSFGRAGSDKPIQGKRDRRVEVENEKGEVVAEYDIILENENEAVVIEVKTTVKKEDVDEHIPLRTLKN